MKIKQQNFNTCDRFQFDKFKVAILQQNGVFIYQLIRIKPSNRQNQWLLSHLLKITLNSKPDSLVIKDGILQTDSQ